MIRSATLIGYSEAAKSVGLDATAMLNRVGLDPRCLDDPETLIPLDPYLALLAHSAAEAKCGDFGARAAIARGTPDLGVMSLLLREAENVEAALRLYSSHLTLHSDGTVVRLDKRFESPFVVMELPANSREEAVQATQFCIVGTIMQIRWLLGEEFQPELVCLAFPRPPSSHPPHRFFACEVLYNQTVSGIVVSRELLARTLVTSEPFLRRIALQQIEPILQKSPDSFTVKVYRVVKRLLPEGSCSSQAVAAHFRIDRRTLNRRLEREGASFSSVLQQVRVEVTRRSLYGTRSSLTEVADLVGFESLSSFSRWFQASFGCSASDWKRMVPGPAGGTVRPITEGGLSASTALGSEAGSEAAGRVRPATPAAVDPSA